MINLYEDENVYVNRHGFERPSAREVNGDVRFTLRHEVQIERVLGRGDRWELAGRDWGSWNAVFGPHGDDGLPKPRVPKAAPAAEPGRAQTNTTTAPRLGLSVTWIEYRGPGKVRFDKLDPILVTNGKAVTTAHFSVPGTYVLRATANDGELSTTTDITLNVASSQP